MYPIKEVTGLDIAFGVDALQLMPPYKDIPEEFKRHDGIRWNGLFNDWFFCGLSKIELKPKKGVDQNKALRHIKAVMRSFEPPHEHKEAGVAYLLSEWFEDATWEKAKAEKP